jgi:hypothetical protein
MNRSRTSALLMITAGAVLGYIAASSGGRLDRSASAANPPDTIRGAECAQAACPTGLTKGKLLAMSGPNTGLAAALAQNGAARKPNILVIWGDDIGIHNISAYNHGIMGYKTPKHRPPGP